jgi:hypothetical protein
MRGGAMRVDNLASTRCRARARLPWCLASSPFRGWSVGGRSRLCSLGKQLALAVGLPVGLLVAEVKVIVAVKIIVLVRILVRN